jgi:hypothetical protein
MPVARDAGNNSAQQSSGVSDGLQLSANFTNAGGPFTDEPPSDVTRLRKEHPELVAQEQALWERSFEKRKTFFGLLTQTKGRENALVVFQNVESGQLLFDTRYKGELNKKTGNYDRITFPRAGEMKVPQGYVLVLIEHSHPFNFSLCQPSCVGASYARGPSPADFDVARDYSQAFHVIHALGFKDTFIETPPEFYYYGPRIESNGQ